MPDDNLHKTYTLWREYMLILTAILSASPQIVHSFGEILRLNNYSVQYSLCICAYENKYVVALPTLQVNMWAKCA